MDDQEHRYNDFAPENFDFADPSPSTNIRDVKSDHKAFNVVREKGDEVEHSIIDAYSIRLDA